MSEADARPFPARYVRCPTCGAELANVAPTFDLSGRGRDGSVSSNSLVTSARCATGHELMISFRDHPARLEVVEVAQEATGKRGWIGVDLDGTLAHYSGWNGGVIGPPVPAMVERVRKWLAEDREVRIFTARVCDADFRTVWAIQSWSEKHIGKRLAVTNLKDYAMVEIWDDRCVQVERNTGRRVVEKDPTP